jgi:hypothetical protein
MAMPVLEVPPQKVFDEVLKIHREMEFQLRGAVSAGPVLVRSWARRLHCTLPTLKVREGSEPYPEWNEEDRYLILYRVLRQMEQANCSVSLGEAALWMIKLQAVATYRRETLEQMRVQLLDIMIH